MVFEFDPYKSASNFVKHGVDFVDAQRLWDGPTVSFDTKPGTDQVRRLTVGAIDGKHRTAITTMREGRTRTISVRRSRKKEVEAYVRYCQGG